MVCALKRRLIARGVSYNMIQTKFLFLTAVIFSFLAYSQDSLEETKELFMIVKCEEIVQNVYKGIRQSISENSKQIFENAGLDHTDSTDLNRFNEFWDENIPVYTQTTYIQLLGKYSTKYSRKEVARYIRLAKNPEFKDMILEKSGIKNELKQLVNKYKGDLANDMRLVLSQIKAKHSPLTLKLIIDNESVSDPNIELEMTLNLFNNKSDISVFNKNTYQIEIPDKFDYNLIESLSIKYLGKEYIIKRFNNSMPKEIQELSSPLSKSCFEDLEHWTLKIDESKILLETRVSVSQMRE